MLWDRGYLGIRRSRARLQEGRTEIHAGGREAAGQLGAGADEARPRRRQAHQLAADQAPRRIRQGGRGQRHPGRGSLGRLRPHAWTQIAAGKGRAPKPFMLAKGQDARPTRSGTRTAAMPPRRARAGKTAALRSAPQTKTRAPAQGRKAEEGLRDAGFRRASALQPRSSGRRLRTTGCHEIKFDGYRMQLRVEDGEVTLQHPQGARLDRQVRRHRRRPPARCPIASSTARSSRSTTTAPRISRRCRPPVRRQDRQT